MPKRKAATTTEYTVTRIAYSVGDISPDILELASTLGKLRSELWNKYGSLSAWGINKNEIIKEIRNTPHLRKIYGAERFNLSSEIWERTVQSVLDDIHAVQEAAKVQVIRKIYQFFKPEQIRVQKGKKLVWEDIPETSFRQELITALNSSYSVWYQYPLLCRWIRQYYQSGHTHVNNQIVINGTSSYMKSRIKHKTRSITTFLIPSKMVDGKCQWLEIKFKTGRVTPCAGRMRLIFNSSSFELHYPHTTKITVNKQSDIVGLDKGFTEGFYSSDGNIYASGLGEIIKDASQKRTDKNRKRYKLVALSRKTDSEKPERILNNNLGRKKANTKDAIKRQTIKQLIRTDVQNIFNNYGTLVVEDLSKYIKGKKKASCVNRKLSEWSKGELQKSLDEISRRKGAKIILINPAYTSQVDSTNGTLLGKRVGDQFFTYGGVVFQSDKNAATNIKNRASDSEITRFMKKEEVHKILMSRTAKFLEQLGHTFESAISMGWLDKKHLCQGKASRRRS
ncbi:transposase [Calothrix sp. NIES-4071]|nr:transposase [Calothrix sp. NIES-4071]BAZ60172.1 transposase [Calothrix sp. NIES-4105]